MRALSWFGLVLILLGIVSLFVGFPQRESHGVKAGNISVGVQTTETRKIPTAASAVIIVAGVALMIAGNRGRRAV